VENERQEYAEYLDKEQVWDIVDILHMFVKALGAVHSTRVRKHVHKEKQPQRNYAGNLVKLSEKKSIREFDRHAVPAVPDLS
jgi:hypothetical protein